MKTYSMQSLREAFPTIRIYQAGCEAGAILGDRFFTLTDGDVRRFIETNRATFYQAMPCLAPSDVALAIKLNKVSAIT